MNKMLFLNKLYDLLITEGVDKIVFNDKDGSISAFIFEDGKEITGLDFKNFAKLRE